MSSTSPVPGPITAASPAPTGTAPTNPNTPPNPMDAPPQGPHFQCGPAILTYNSGYPMLPTQTPCGYNPGYGHFSHLNNRFGYGSTQNTPYYYSNYAQPFSAYTLNRHQQPLANGYVNNCNPPQRTMWTRQTQWSMQGYY